MKWTSPYVTEAYRLVGQATRTGQELPTECVCL
jgi:hypothetical protein